MNYNATEKIQNSITKGVQNGKMKSIVKDSAQLDTKLGMLNMKYKSIVENIKTEHKQSIDCIYNKFSTKIDRISKKIEKFQTSNGVIKNDETDKDIEDLIAKINTMVAKVESNARKALEKDMGKEITKEIKMLKDEMNKIEEGYRREVNDAIKDEITIKDLSRKMLYAALSANRLPKTFVGAVITTVGGICVLTNPIGLVTVAGIGAVCYGLSLLSKCGIVSAIREEKMNEGKILSFEPIEKIIQDEKIAEKLVQKPARKEQQSPIY
ncbi:MAG: hypothetical protein QW112_03085 [Candidatus Micrarchaeia archaeon]